MNVFDCLFVVYVLLSGPLLVMCGYSTAPKTQRGKRKNQEEPNCPQPAKNPYVNAANLFKSTECLLLSLIRKEAFDEADSPMREVFSSKETKLETHRGQQPVFRGRRASDGDRLDGSYLEIPQAHKTEVLFARLRSRSCSLEGIVDNHSKNTLLRSSESLQSCSSDQSSSQTDSPVDPNLKFELRGSSMSINSCVQTSSNITSSQLPSDLRQTNQRPYRARPRSIGNLFDIEENRAMSASSFSIHAPVAEITMRPDSTSSIGLRGPGLLRLHGSCMDIRAGPSFSRRCQSSLDLSKPAPTRPPLARHPEQSKSMWKTHINHEDVLVCLCLSMCLFVPARLTWIIILKGIVHRKWKLKMYSPSCCSKLVWFTVLSCMEHKRDT